MLAVGCKPMSKTSARTEAISASRCSFAGNVRELRSQSRPVASKGGVGSRCKQLAVRADGEAIVEIVDAGDGKQGPAGTSSSAAGNGSAAAGAPGAAPDSLGALLNGNGQNPRPQGQALETPPTPLGRASIVGYKQAVTVALAKATQQGASTAEISLARHKLLTGRNDAVRQAYEKASNVNEVLLGAEDPVERNGADASTSALATTPKAQELATQLAHLLSEKAKIEVTGQLNRVRDKMTSRVSKANSYARYLEAGIRQRDKAIADSYLRLESLKEEVDNMRRMLEDGAKESPYIVDRTLITERFETLAARAQYLRKQVDIATDTVDQQRVRRVRVEWTGYAEEVRLMGSFDNWTRGVPLTREDIDDNQGGLCLYSVEIPLRPGVYEMKLFCDGQWFEIRDWPVDDSPRRNSICHVK